MYSTQTNSIPQFLCVPIVLPTPCIYKDLLTSIFFLGDYVNCKVVPVINKLTATPGMSMGDVDVQIFDLGTS
jgi:hypothetical protein